MLPRRMGGKRRGRGAGGRRDWAVIREARRVGGRGETVGEGGVSWGGEGRGTGGGG